MVMLSQFREWLAAIQETEGDVEVRFPALVDADSEDSDTVAVEGVSVFADEGNPEPYLLICDVYTLDNLGE